MRRSFQARIPTIIRDNARSGAYLGARVLYRDGYPPMRYVNARVVGILK